MNRPFKILIVDDDIYQTACLLLTSGREVPWRRMQCQAVAELLERNGKEDLVVEVFLSEGAGLRKVFSVVNKAYLPEQILDTRDKIRSFIATVDVLILDIQGIGKRFSKEFNQAVSDNFKRLGSNQPLPGVPLSSDSLHHGIEFFHIHLSSLSRNALVAILTKNDGTPDPVIDAYINDFTIQDFGRNRSHEAEVDLSPDIPYVVKFGKNDTAGAWLTDLILSHFDFFISGLSDATNRFHISFAASHDQPVMIVGESGTGKEGIARFIHKQWARRKIKENPNLSKRVGRFQVINCGGLTEQLAQTELFGYIKGSFTGADEHRLGKVSIAAGIDSPGKSNSKQRIAFNSDANADISDLISAIKELDQASDENIHGAKRTVISALDRLFRPEGALNPTIKRLVSALNQVEELIKNPLKFSNTNGDFFSRILAGSDGLLRVPNSKSEYSDNLSDSDEYNLEYSLDNPIGTLFLDEFADLPLSVQTLLLRFLQSGEVQPLGFSGRILGLKVRIIVATSDSRVAEFAGTPVSDDFRTPEELKRPLRNDLLHRVRFQTIRTEPVTIDNVERILKGMIAQRTNVDWDDEAVNYLVTAIRNILDCSVVEPESQTGSATPGYSRRASFGHRRELSRVVDLVWEYARSVGSRGVRDGDLETREGRFVAKKGLIERLWSPAMIVSVDPGGSNTTKPGPMPNDETKGRDELIEAVRSRFVADVSEFLILPDNWTWDTNIGKYLSKIDKEHVASFSKAVKKAFADCDNENIVCSALEGPGALKDQPRLRNTFYKYLTPTKKN